MLKKVIESLAGLPAVPPGSAKAYERASEALVSHVNDELEAHPQIGEFLGGQPFALIRNNHRNHAAFMTTVWKTGSYELLARTVPWVYRAYHARGVSYDYFPAELTAWKHAVAAGLTGVHTAEIINCYDWMIGQHERMIALSVSGEGLAFSLMKETTEMQEVLLSLLLQGDSRGSLHLASQSVQTIDDLKHFYLEVVCPVMVRIGLLWEKNDISVAEEHVATAIVGRITAALYPLFANVTPHRGKAVVTAGPNEFHELGARMLSDFLEMEGWEVTYLGANTPPEALLAVLRGEKPFLVALSVATVFNLDPAREIIERIRADSDTGDMKIMVGGVAFNGMPDLWCAIGADGYAADAQEGVLSANGWWEGKIAP